MYDSTGELAHEIEAGEDTFLELKEVFFRGDSPRFADEESRAAEAVAQVLYSFADTEGGVAVFGVNDRRQVVGIAEDKIGTLEEWLLHIAQNNCDPPVYLTLDRRRLPDPGGALRSCLKVDIPKSLYVHRTSGGRWLMRLGSHWVDMIAEQLARLIEKRCIAGPFEERSLQSARLDDLNATLFEDYCLRWFGPDGEDTALVDMESRLVNLRLAARLENGRVVPTVMGILLFGRPALPLRPGEGGPGWVRRFPSTLKQSFQSLDTPCPV
ncbi:MAG: ATP-binding protein [Armatimonadetes bacterium]|nr:ATP-binding protein [Armatimonadota bacterium]